MSQGKLLARGGVGGVGVLVLLTCGGGGGGVVQNRECPDFRSPEVGRYAFVMPPQRQTWSLELLTEQLRMYI